MKKPSVGFGEINRQFNMKNLADNPYPGRGIVLGRNPDGDTAVQIYWVMGRREDSRNRVLVADGLTVRTEPIDPTKVQHPERIIYDAMHTLSFFEGESIIHVVSNGNQTNTVTNKLIHANSLGSRNLREPFSRALLTREYEADDPNFTARITGMVAVAGATEYGYSLIRRIPLTGQTEHTIGFGDLEADIPSGTGICYHTYADNGDPLPVFEGSPYSVTIGANAAPEIAAAWWDHLNEANRVGLAVKTIDMRTGEAQVEVVNQYEQAS